MNFPNLLSISRIFLTIFFILFLFQSGKWMKVIAFVIFIIATLTDYFDGYFARKKNIITDLGKFLDPLADKVLILGAFVSAIQLNVIPAWMVIIILAREFSITGLRLLGAMKGKVISASKGGKHKMVSQVIAVYAILIYILLINFYPEHHFRFYFKNCIYWWMYVTIFLTLYSGTSYVIKNKDIF
jgi:CDP-diacylglycerol--glycerol-3-phosphate 3-phosphatidyltransferase